MTWSRFDDGYDEHDKVEQAWETHRATIGLHVMATTACNRWLSDGVIKPRWLAAKLPTSKERARVLSAMVDAGLFDVLPAGTSRVVGSYNDTEITVGPFPEERYLVHGFLDRHDSSLKVKARREADAERKAALRAAQDAKRNAQGVQAESEGLPAESNGNPAGLPAESEASRAGALPRPDPTLPLTAKTTTPPTPPEGGRTRERHLFEQKMKAWAAEQFPGVPVPKVRALADHLRFNGIEPSVEEMRSYGDRDPRWALEAAA